MQWQHSGDDLMPRGPLVSVPAVHYLARGGKTVKEIAVILGCVENAIWNICKRENISGPNLRKALYKSTPTTAPTPTVPLPPPRPSMYALAAFDPVVARALKERTALPCEL